MNELTQNIFSDHNKILNFALKKSSNLISEILFKSLNGIEISEDEGTLLFKAKNKDDVDAIYLTAKYLCRLVNKDKVTFVVNRNINFTNVCHMGCKFCNFAKRMKDKTSEWLNLHEIVYRSQEAWDRGASEVCIQGGLHPKMDGEYYFDIVKAIKSKLPDMHIHAFSPFEIWYGSSKTRMSYKSFLSELRKMGLGSIPGTAAEILDTEIRKKLTKNKLSAEKWVEIIKTAHSVGLKSSATIMYGHIDSAENWSSHISLLRDIQKETGGFTELVPLSFVYEDSPLYTQNQDIVRKGPTEEEVNKMHSISRIMLHGFIDNIQVSWPKLGSKRAQELLNMGVNDLGGTLMNESISRAAGAKNGQEITAREISDIIRDANLTPARRNTLYEIKEVFENHNPIDIPPLVERNGFDPLSFLNT